MSLVQFSLGTLASYKAITTPDNNTIYFMTDSPLVYRGSVLCNDVIQFVTAFPTTDMQQGIIYINETTFEAKVYTTTGWKVINKGFTTAISNSASSHDKIPTEKAVYDFVVNKIADVVAGDGTFVTDVAFVPASKSLNINKGSQTSSVALTGMAHSPTYDSATRKITIPIVGGTALEINLGKDLVVSSGTYNTTTKAIDLTLTSGNVISIPVGELVDVYTGAQTSSATTTVSSGKEISVVIRTSAVAGNQVVVKSDGLYVSATDVSGKLDKVTSAKAGEIITALADGGVQVSGLKAGGSTLASTPNVSTLATEIAVNAVKIALQNSINTLSSTVDGKIAKTSIVQTIASASTTTVPSESAVLSALSWKTR